LDYKCYCGTSLYYSGGEWLCRSGHPVHLCKNCQALNKSVPLQWIPKYQRWYCYECEKYAPLFGKRPPTIDQATNLQVRAMAATTVSLSSQLIRLGEEVKEIENRREKLEEKRYKLKSELSSLSKTEEKDKAKAAKIASEITKLTALIKETNNEYKLKAKEENAVMAALNRTGFRKG